MSQAPSISRVLIVPGLPVATADFPQNTHFHTISFGLVVDETRLFWGEYQPDSGGVNPLTILQEKIVPVLERRPLAEFREMMDELDGLTETAVLIRPLPQLPSGSISRRGFLTGNMETAVKTEQVVVERPLSPALRSSISQTLLTALAGTRGLTITELIAAEYKLPLRPTLVPIYLDINADDPAPDATILSNQIAALGYRISSGNPQAQLGPNGERLQRFIRQLTALIERVTQEDYRPAVHLDLNGGLGVLFENNIGRILGTIYGLEQAAKPFPLRITDPILIDDLAQQIELMRQLKEYMRMRGMKTELVVNNPIQSLADVQQFVESAAAHMLEISLSRLGTIQQSAQAVQICQKAKMSILLRDGNHSFASQFALATQPNLILATWEPNNFGSLDPIYSEMAKTIAFVTQNRA